MLTIRLIVKSTLFSSIFLYILQCPFGVVGQNNFEFESAITDDQLNMDNEIHSRSLQSQENSMKKVYEGLGLEIPEGGLCDWDHITCNEFDLVIEFKVPPMHPEGKTGIIPSEIGSIVSLKSIYINNNLVGTIPSEIGELKNLRHLYLNNYYNEFTSTDWTVNLVDTNKLTGTLPQEFDLLSSLSELYLGHNELSGTFPQSNQWNVLEVINLDSNNFSGPVPTTVTNKIFLRVFSLNNNDFTGTFPRALLENLSTLQYIGLSGNKLTGTIPKDWTSPRLEQLELSDNEFSGTIPSEIGGLTSIWYLDLSNNELTGEIPNELGHIYGPLVHVDLSDNKLSGDASILCHVETFIVEGNEDVSSNCNKPSVQIALWMENSGFLEWEASLQRLQNAIAIFLDNPSIIFDMIEGYIQNTILNEDLKK